MPLRFSVHPDCRAMFRRGRNVNAAIGPLPALACHSPRPQRTAASRPSYRSGQLRGPVWIDRCRVHVGGFCTTHSATACPSEEDGPAFASLRPPTSGAASQCCQSRPVCEAPRRRWRYASQSTSSSRSVSTSMFGTTPDTSLSGTPVRTRIVFSPAD